MRFVTIAALASAVSAALHMSILMPGLNSARAAEQTAAWNGSTGNWTDASKWSTVAYPDNGNGGVATYDAVIHGGTVTLDVDATIESFFYGADGFSANLTRAASLTINDTFEWDRGNLLGSGTLTLATGSNTMIGTDIGGVNIRDGNIVNHGIVNWAGGPRLLFRDADFINHGTTDAQSDGNFIERNSFSPAGNVQVSNTGTFLKSGGSGNTLINATKFTNSGLVEVQTGRLGFVRGFAGGTPGYTQTAGTLLLSGGDVYADDVPMDIQGGSIEGDGTISGDILLAGTIAPGPSVGTIAIDDNAASAEGDLSFATGGEYVADLAAGELADLLDLTGTLDLTTAGDKLTLAGGVVGETYTIATYASVSGSFDNVTPGYQVDYGATAMTVFLVTVVPGDFNFDGNVDAADYVVWRKSDGTPDGYNTWRTHLGHSAGSGAELPIVGMLATVPEPSTEMLQILAAAGFLINRYRRSRRALTRHDFALHLGVWVTSFVANGEPTDVTRM